MLILLILILIVAFCVGVLIGRSNRKFDGMFIVNDSDEEITRWILDVNIDPMDIPKKKEVRLKVRKMTEEGDV